MFFWEYQSKLFKGIDYYDLLEDKLSGSNNENNKKRTTMQDFLNSIDQTGKLLIIFEDDETGEFKQERMEKT